MASLKKQNYKHTITEELFLEALTATDEYFEAKKDYFNKFGIHRINGSELRKDMPGLLWLGISNERVTYISDAKIKRDLNKNALTLYNIQNPDLNSLFLYNCHSDTIQIVNCTLAKREKKILFGFSIYLIGTFVQGILIKDSHIGNISTNRLESNNLAIENSNVWNFTLHNSHIITFAFNNSIGWEVRTKFDCNISLISIKETELNGLYFRKSKSNEIRIFKKSKLNVLYIQSSEVDEFQISNLSSSKKISIDLGASIGNAYLSHNIDINSLSIRDSTIDNLEIDNDVRINSIGFRNAVLTFFRGENLSSNFYFGNVKGVEAKILNSNCNMLTIKDCRTDFYIEDGAINLLNLSKSSLPQTSTISISSEKIFSVIMNELSVFGKLSFIKNEALKSPFTVDHQELDFKKEIERFSLKKSTFRIVYSSLGETEFIDSDLNGFDSFEFSNSRVTQTFLTGGSLPKDNIHIYKTEYKSEEWYDQMVSLFNQFSSIFQAQGHIYQAIDFRSKSSEYQMELLKKKRAWIDLIPFKLNAWSNQHGASWAKAFWFLIWTSVLLYMGILLTTGNIFQLDYSFEPAFIGHYFDFINPFRPFNFYSEIGLKINGWSRFVDLLSRVVIGYGIYQLITAFRRYGRK